MLSFPRSAMIGSLGELAIELGRDNEVPEEFLFADALTVAGAIMSGRFTLDLGLESDTRLYTVTVGESADTKKTTAQTKVIKFFRQLNLPEWNTCYGVGSAEGLAKALSKDCRVVLAIDELKQVLQKTQIRGSVLLPMITSLYERIDYENQTKDASISLDEGRLAILANSTLDTFESLWDHEAQAIGLVNRMFLVTNAGKARVAWPRSPAKAILENLSLRIREQLTNPPPAPYLITPEAEAIWTKWYEALPKDEFVKRLDGLGFRLMPILTATCDKLEVDAEVITAVTNLLNYELEVRKVLHPIDADNAIAKLEQKIVRQVSSNENFYTRRELARAIHADRAGYWRFRTALDNMEKNNSVYLNPTTKRYVIPDQGLEDVPTPKGKPN